METMFQLAAVAVMAVTLAAVLRRSAAECAFLVLLTAGIWMLGMVLGALEDVVNMLARLARLARLDGMVVEPVLKTVGLSILTRITGEVCRSAGEGGVAAFVEVAGTILALAQALPLCGAVADMIVEMLA